MCPQVPAAARAGAQQGAGLRQGLGAGAWAGVGGRRRQRRCQVDRHHYDGESCAGMMGMCGWMWGEGWWLPGEKQQGQAH